MKKSKGFGSLLVIFVVAVLLIGGVGYFFIKQNNQTITHPTASPVISTSPLVNATHASSSSLFEWKVTKKLELHFGNPSRTQTLTLFESVGPKGKTGTDDSEYGMKLIITEGGKTLYEFVPTYTGEPYSGGYFYNTDTIDLEDVTNDKIPEIIFTISSQPGADNYYIGYFILRYNPKDNSFNRIDLTEFSETAYSAFKFLDLGKGAEAVHAENVQSHDMCMSCADSYKYSIYKWSGESFIIDRVIKTPTAKGDWFNDENLNYVRSQIN